MSNMDKFMFYFRDLESPAIFLRYTYLWTISAALQRRVYHGDPAFPLFANVFFAFVAEPGIGKSLAARQAGDKILRTFHVANRKKLGADGEPEMIPRVSFCADSTSPPALIKSLADSIRSYYATIKDPQTGETRQKPVAHNSMAMLLSEEMTSLFRRDAEDIAAYMNHWYDAGNFEYKIIGRDGGDCIKNVCVTFLGCTTPRNMRKIMATGILDDGFTARAICLFADKKRHYKAEFRFKEEQIQALEDIKKHVEKVLNIEGQCWFSEEAEKWFTDYYESGKLQNEVVNKHVSLQNYVGRIKVHARKLAMLLHFGETTETMEISLSTVKLAINYLREAEMQMHKALASTARNPYHDVGMLIVDYLKLQGPQTKPKLLILFGPMLDQDELSLCIEYLIMCQYIILDGGKYKYIVKE